MLHTYAGEEWPWWQWYTRSGLPGWHYDDPPPELLRAVVILPMQELLANRHSGQAKHASSLVEAAVALDALIETEAIGLLSAAQCGTILNILQRLLVAGDTRGFTELLILFAMCSLDTDELLLLADSLAVPSAAGRGLNARPRLHNVARRAVAILGRGTPGLVRARFSAITSTNSRPHDRRSGINHTLISPGSHSYGRLWSLRPL